MGARDALRPLEMAVPDKRGDTSTARAVFVLGILVDVHHLGLLRRTILSTVQTPNQTQYFHTQYIDL